VSLLNFPHARRPLTNGFLFFIFYLFHLFLILTFILPFYNSSNGGVFGSLYGTPIINLPQAAVLGEENDSPWDGETDEQRALQECMPSKNGRWW